MVVIPAKAGIHGTGKMDSGFRRNDNQFTDFMGENVVLRGLLAGAVVCATGVVTAATISRAPAVQGTTPAISAADLRTRVFIFADDSMEGRAAGSIGNRKATDYIASELKRLGVRPAGDSGSYFQHIPAPGARRDSAVPDPRYRNVIGIIQGSDPRLGEEYVALGAHNDHVGRATAPVDHDAARVTAARNDLTRRLRRLPTAEDLSRVGADLDSLRRLRPARLDSINNGADDDGSGSMALLELAEYFAALPESQRPRRSLVLVWHSNEEIDLGGSRYFVQHTPMPRQNIVAQINIDMIGRGGVNDVDGGGPNYLLLVGSRRLSTRLGVVIDSVNAAASPAARFNIDYSWDAPDHPEQIYTRSDHYSYAQAGIPVAFVFTGLHIDYHRVTDEPQYLDYPKLEKVARFVAEIVRAVGNDPERPRVDRR